MSAVMELTRLTIKMIPLGILVTVVLIMALPVALVAPVVVPGADIATRRGGSRRYIALIDDNHSISESIIDGLPLFLEGSKVAWYTNAENWVAHGSPRYEVFIVDHDMGFNIMNGPAAVRIIRTRWPDVFIIGWSANPEVGAAFLAAGADVFAPKPISFDDLVKLITTG